MHAESASDTADEDLFSALALLRSTDEDSAEKLRCMLDACIERKYGPGKTLAARMPRRFLQSVDDSPTSRRARGRAATKIETRDESVSSLGTADSVAESVATRTREIAEIDREDCCCDEDVPTISIPDEGSVDGTVCKICNGAKLGPLILLECQECQEAYHPLCHQPPVVDVDVYDPRFVWRCRRCVETPSETSLRINAAEEGPADEARVDDTVKKRKGTTRSRVFARRRDVSFAKNDLMESRNTQLRDSSPFARDLSNVSQRDGSLSSSTQSRKRIGSKLSVVRASIK